MGLKFRILTFVRYPFFGKPWVIQMGADGGWKEEDQTYCFAERELHRRFHGRGARPRLLRRRNDLAIGTFYQFGRDVLNEVQFGLRAVLNCGGFSAYQMGFGANPADLYMATVTSYRKPRFRVSSRISGS